MRTRWRRVTGKPSAYQISNGDIDTVINDYYQDEFVQQVCPPELKGWYEFSTVASTGSQDLPVTVGSIQAPAYIDGERVDLFTDIGGFYDIYPLSDTTEHEPQALLLEDRSLIIRPIPDDVYAVKIRKFARPEELSGNSSAPLKNSWALSIIYGSARNHLQEEGDTDGAKEADILFKNQLKIINSEIVSQIPIGTRALPRL